MISCSWYSYSKLRPTAAVQRILPFSIKVSSRSGSCCSSGMCCSRWLRRLLGLFMALVVLDDHVDLGGACGPGLLGLLQRLQQVAVGVSVTGRQQAGGHCWTARLCKRQRCGWPGGCAGT